MDSKELRSIQEAYMEVVMNEINEGYKDLPVDKMIAKSKSLSRIPREPGAPRWDKNAQRASDIRKTAGTHSRAKVKKVEKANRERETQREEYDLYDIILSHLLDEGYAETPEAAEAIMVNMSEEWRDSIVEEMLDEGKKEFPFDKVHQKVAKHEGDEIKTRSYKSGLRARKMKAIASTVDAGGDPRNTWGRDLRKIR